jgi:hypothetical protein
VGQKTQQKNPLHRAGLSLMTNLMYAQNERMSPNRKQENQVIDFRLLTKKKEKPRFFLLFHQSETRYSERVLPDITTAVTTANCVSPATTG